MSDAVARLFNVPSRSVARAVATPLQQDAASTPHSQPVLVHEAATGASGGFKRSVPSQSQGAMGVALQGATLRGRPSNDDPVVQQLAAGASLELISQLQNEM